MRTTASVLQPSLLRKVPTSRWPLRAGPAIAVALLLAAQGCAGTKAAMRPDRVAVLPLRAVGVAPQIAADVRRTIGEGVARATATALVADARVDRVTDGISACSSGGAAAQEACASEAGATLGASHVVVGALGGLGKTYVVQLRVVDVAKASVPRALEETIFGGPEALANGAAPMALRLFDRPPAPPWYTRWWVWTAVAVAAGAAVALPLAFSSGDPYEDVPLP